VSKAMGPKLALLQGPLCIWGRFASQAVKGDRVGTAANRRCWVVSCQNRPKGV
jgi:hypothetical protein